MFEGNCSILFGNSCGLYNQSGQTRLGLYAFSSDVTRNYLGGNTVDICIMSGTGRTITLYSVDSYLLENKFNNIVKKYSSNKKFNVLINH